MWTSTTGKTGNHRTKTQHGGDLTVYRRDPQVWGLQLLQPPLSRQPLSAQNMQHCLFALVQPQFQTGPYGGRTACGLRPGSDLGDATGGCFSDIGDVELQKTMKPASGLTCRRRPPVPRKGCSLSLWLLRQQAGVGRRWRCELGASWPRLRLRVLSSWRSYCKPSRWPSSARTPSEAPRA